MTAAEVAQWQTDNAAYIWGRLRIAGLVSNAYSQSAERALIPVVRSLADGVRSLDARLAAKYSPTAPLTGGVDGSLAGSPSPGVEPAHEPTQVEIESLKRHLKVIEELFPPGNDRVRALNHLAYVEYRRLTGSDAPISRTRYVIVVHAFQAAVAELFQKTDRSPAVDG